MILAGSSGISCFMGLDLKEKPRRFRGLLIKAIILGQSDILVPISIASGTNAKRDPDGPPPATREYYFPLKWDWLTLALEAGCPFPDFLEDHILLTGIPLLAVPMYP